MSHAVMRGIYDDVEEESSKRLASTRGRKKSYLYGALFGEGGCLGMEPEHQCRIRWIS
jgi:hypothetical protein